MDKTIAGLWWDSCIRPRELIKTIIQFDPAHLMWTNIFISTALTIALVTLSEQKEFSTILPILLTPVAILLYIYINAWLLAWSGRLLGGTGNAEAFRAALVWSIPASVFIQLIDYSYRYLTSNQTSIALTTIQFAGFIWVMSISIRFISQLQGFSIGKAMVNFLSPLFLVIAVSLMIQIWK